MGNLENRSHLLYGRVMSAAQTLAALGPGERGLVAEVQGDPEVARWLRALGIEAGTSLTVLRRGLWGGPLHVRAASGAEFALDGALARDVVLETLAT